MANLSIIDRIKFEKLFEMDTGYVLDFSNRSFREFIFNTTGKEIYASKYDYESGSKANRLRAFLDSEKDIVAGKLLYEMLEYWKAQKHISNITISNNEQNLYDDCLEIVLRLQGKKPTDRNIESDFLVRDFSQKSLKLLSLEGSLITVISQRMEEIDRCMSANAPLAAIFLAGSTLEGLLLGIASNHARDYNQCPSCPKDKSGKPKKFPEWTLNELINVSCSLNMIGEDVKKFSHALRGFRNYIHPYEQASTGFNPDIETAEISVKVLKAAISDLGK